MPAFPRHYPQPPSQTLGTMTSQTSCSSLDSPPNSSSVEPSKPTDLHPTTPEGLPSPSPSSHSTPDSDSHPHSHSHCHSHCRPRLLALALRLPVGSPDPANSSPSQPQAQLASSSPELLEPPSHPTPMQASLLGFHPLLTEIEVSSSGSAFFVMEELHYDRQHLYAKLSRFENALGF